MVEPAPDKSVFLASESLKFRALLVLHLIVKKENILRAPYIYYHNRSYHRLTEMTKFSKDVCIEGENVLCIEKSCFFDDVFWKLSKEELFEIFIKDLERDNILKREQIMKIFLYKNPNVYPVYAHKYIDSLKIVENYLKNIPDFKYLGRLGAFLYLDSDQTLERSFKIAEELALDFKKKQNDKKTND